MKIRHPEYFPPHATVHAAGRFLTAYNGLLCYAYDGRYVATDGDVVIASAQTEDDLYDYLGRAMT